MESVALTEAVFYILLSLGEPLHGYGIMQNAEALSNGRVRLAAGTLYGALGTLVDKGWIEEVPASGRSAVEAELARLRELLENGERVVEGWSQ